MGAYDFGFYKQGMDGSKDARLGSALIGIKKELVYRGFGKAIIPDTPVFGEAAANRLGDFQAWAGLTVDKKAGPITLRELFRKQVENIEQAFRFKIGTLGRQIWLESNFDPAAKGIVDPDDTGMVQINLRIHTEVTQAEALDPVFAIDWAAQYIADQESRIVTEINAIKAARAAYNVGAEYAKQWLLAGFPASGGPQIGNEDSFARATKYIALIDKQVW